jgi:CheY-like chemotaxis protein
MASVLVADDAAIVRHIVSEMLRAAGHTVIAEAATGDEVVELYGQLRPDVLVVDVNMPGCDGFTAAATIRETDPDVRVVLASVLVDGPRWERARAAGVTEFVAKPFEAGDLLAALDRALA